MPAQRPRLIEKRYLGDSVYAEVVNGMIKLTTENEGPDRPSNTIYLEPTTMLALQDYFCEALKAADAAREGTAVQP
jgi:hypothetical protein